MEKEEEENKQLELVCNKWCVYPICKQENMFMYVYSSSINLVSIVESFLNPTSQKNRKNTNRFPYRKI